MNDRFIVALIFVQLMIGVVGVILVIEAMRQALLLIK